MADEEKERVETSSRGNDWEVVSLTSSTYAAAPGPEGLDPAEEDKDEELNMAELESSRAMFMSGFYVFPPSEHENLPLEPEYSEIHAEPGSQYLGPNNEDVVEPNKTQEVELHGTQYFDKGRGLYLRGMEIEEGKTSQDLKLFGEEQGIYSEPVFSSINSEADSSELGQSALSTSVPEHGDPSPQNLGSSLKAMSPFDEGTPKGSGLPCETWWKRHAASLYAHAKEANTVWSIFVAAALMGLVILGQQWQQERWKMHQFKWHFSINDEKTSRILGPISRFKEVLVGGHRRAPVIRGSSSADR